MFYLIKVCVFYAYWGDLKAIVLIFLFFNSYLFEGSSVSKSLGLADICLFFNKEALFHGFKS
jgi:hypothetical protein